MAIFVVAFTFSSIKNSMEKQSSSYGSSNDSKQMYPLPMLYPSVVPYQPTYPSLDEPTNQPVPINQYPNELPPMGVPTNFYFTPEQILSLDELAIDCMSYVDINRLYESVLLIHHRGLVDIQKFTDYLKLKQVEQLIVNALYKDTENWRVMLSSYDKCHRVNQARLTFLKEQYDKHKY